MLVTELRVVNFRGFESEEFVFREPFTVLIGDNGTGKTALLQALAIGAGTAFRTVMPEPSIELADVRLRRFQHDLVVSAEPQFPAEIEVRGPDLTAQTGRDSSIGSFSASGGPSEELVSAVRSGSKYPLPLLVRYPTERLTRRGESRVDTTVSRLAAYESALDALLEDEAFTHWLRRRTGQSLQEERSPGDLESVLGALQAALPEWNSVRFDFTEDELVALKVENGVELDRLRMSMLSDGQRAMLRLIADIAFRCAVLNPQLGAEAARDTRGLVLIDELDLHLHPRWQRTVVDDLRRAFPNLQFVTTSHSPFIVQSLPAGAVIDLSPPAIAGDQPNEPEPTDFRKRSIEDIAEEAMGVPNPQWSEKRLELFEAAKRYYELLEAQREEGAPELREAERRLDQASAPFADDPAFAAQRIVGRRGP